MTRGRYRKGFFVEVERDGRMLKSSWRMHLKIPIRSCIISILYE